MGLKVIILLSGIEKFYYSFWQRFDIKIRHKMQDIRCKEEPNLKDLFLYYLRLTSHISRLTNWPQKP